MNPIEFLYQVLDTHETETEAAAASFVVDDINDENKNENAQSNPTAIIKLASEFLDREHPGLLEGAIETLDRAPIIKIITKQYHRELHLVKGKDKSQYTIFNRRDCTCQSFQQMQYRSLSPNCKHLLAVRLAPFFQGRLEIQEVLDEYFEQYVALGFHTST